jgi:hypothetical protein
MLQHCDMKVAVRAGSRQNMVNATGAGRYALRSRCTKRVQRQSTRAFAIGRNRSLAKRRAA